MVDIAVGRDFCVALTEEADAISWGSFVFPPARLSDAVGLSAGRGFGLAARADGTVVAWGASSGFRVCNSIPAGLSNVVAVSAGAFGHALALRSDGIVVAWGATNYFQCQVPSGLKDVVAISAGGQHSLALKADGTVIAWGDNREGQCNVPTNLMKALSVAAGWHHSLALQYDGTVLAWGANNRGESLVPSGLSEVVAVAAGPGFSVALRRDGTVAFWGYSDEDLSAVMNWSHIVGIMAGARHIVGLKGDGTIVVAGNNDYGQAEVPPELKNVSSIAAGDYFVLAAVGDGPLASALGDGSDFRWRTGGELPWVAQMLVTQDGRLAAQSAGLMPGEESWLETSVRGPGTLRFWWRTAFASDQDALELVLNGVTVERVTGNTEWEPGRLAVHSGSSTVRWRYIQAAASTQGAPAAWLDEVTFEPVPSPALVITETDDSQITARCESVQGLFYTLQSAFTLDGAHTEWETVETLIGTDLPVAFVRPCGMEHAEFFRVVVE